MMKFTKKNHLAFFNIAKEPMLVQKQTIPQKKALDLSFNLTSWKGAWHYQDGATPSRREKHILLNFMGAEGFWLLAFYEISRTKFFELQSLLRCQIKAEIKGFLLMYSVLKYKHWFFQNFELKHFPDSPVHSIFSESLIFNLWSFCSTLFHSFFYSSFCYFFFSAILSFFSHLLVINWIFCDYNLNFKKRNSHCYFTRLNL